MGRAEWKVGDELGGFCRSPVRRGWWLDSEGPVRLFGSSQVSDFLRGRLMRLEDLGEVGSTG